MENQVTEDMKAFEGFINDKESKLHNDCLLIADRLFDFNRTERTRVILSASLMFNRKEKPEQFFNEIGEGFMRCINGDLTPEAYQLVKSMVIKKAEHYLRGPDDE